MSNYWATAMIVDSIERERRQAAEAARGARASRFDDGSYIGGSDPGHQGKGGRGERPRPRRFSFRGGPITVSISIGLQPEARP